MLPKRLFGVMIPLMFLHLERSLAGLVAFAAIVSAAGVSGIWMGQAPGRNDTKEDVAFQFKQTGAAVTGKLFGDEFDLALEEGSVSGEKLTFIVTTTNYYNGVKVRFQYTGTIKGDELELTRTRIGEPTVENPSNRKIPPQTFTVKRLK